MEFYFFGNSLMWEFNCLYFLTEEIEKFLIKGANEKFTEYLEEFDGYDSWIIQEIRMQGYFTVGDLIRLGKENPIKSYHYDVNQRKSSSISLKGDELEMFNEDFPKISWESLTIMSFSTFENVLKRLIKYVAQIQDIEIQLNTTENIDYLDFLKEKIHNELELGFNFGTSSNWCSIKERKKIRNKIVHNNGFVDEDDSRNRELINKTNNASLVNDRISINKDFVTETIEQMQNFIIELMDKISDRYS